LEREWLDSHDLRKAFGSFLLVQSTADFQTVSKGMGHSNPSVTLGIYAKPIEEAELAHKNDIGLAFPLVPEHRSRLNPSQLSIHSL
jgi:integrase